MPEPQGSKRKGIFSKQVLFPNFDFLAVSQVGSSFLCFLAKNKRICVLKREETSEGDYCLKILCY